MKMFKRQQLVWCLGLSGVIVVSASYANAAEPVRFRVNEKLLGSKIRASIENGRLHVEHGHAVYGVTTLSKRSGLRVGFYPLGSPLGGKPIATAKWGDGARAGKGQDILVAADGQKAAALCIPHVSSKPALITGFQRRKGKRWSEKHDRQSVALVKFHLHGPSDVLAGTDLRVAESLKEVGRVLAEVDGERVDLLNFDLEALRPEQRNALLGSLLVEGEKLERLGAEGSASKRTGQLFFDIARRLSPEP